MTGADYGMVLVSKQAQGLYGGMFPSLQAAAMHHQMSEIGKLSMMAGMGPAEAAAARAALGREQEERPTSSGGSRSSGGRKNDSLASLKAAARSLAKAGDTKEGDRPRGERSDHAGDQHLRRHGDDEDRKHPHSSSPRCAANIVASIPLAHSPREYAAALLILRPFEQLHRHECLVCAAISERYVLVCALDGACHLDAQIPNTTADLYVAACPGVWSWLCNVAHVR